ncbi:MAG TPA: penicillin-binding protein [Candidatus Limnocylindrales bacterium]|nr:penicillin-binding protein [Candidatus Limnocylindrales bacterium]
MEHRNSRLRWLVVWVLAVVWMGAVLARLSYLQLFCYSEYFARAQRQQQRIFEISPKRGTIYDRKGRELAVSLPMDSVFADPAEITDAAMVARLLSRPLSVPADDLEAKIREAHTPVRLARKLSPETVQRIDDMNLKGVFFQKENRRVYPQRDLAAHVLGYVDVDEKGIGGIEQSLDKEIRGSPGKMMVMADGRRRWYDRMEDAADPGASVELTIDETIQYIAEKELSRAIAQTHAIHGTVLVQDPNTGELLAVANWPTFDPNDAGSFPADSRMDRAVTMSYEPGSVFKVLTMTGAIEHGVVNANELIDCQMGKIVLAGRLIHDHKAYGILSVRQILQNSSDVGSIKVALRLGAPRFYDVMRQFGIGQMTGILLPGESRGLLRPLDDWTPSSIGSLAMGQEVSVTPIQIISAISAIANGGTLYRPRVVREVRGGIVPFSLPGNDPARVTDAKTAATLRSMMEDVILNGTGKGFTELDGYSAGGKTGTAQKIDPNTGRYSHTAYFASFAGFAPVNDPAVTILVVLDSPVGGHEGNATAGPVFKRIAEQVLSYMDVPHDVPSPSDTETAKNLRGLQKPAARMVANTDATKARFEAAIAKRGRSESAPTVAFGSPGAIVVPNLAGETVRDVTEACSRLGLVPSLIGTGVAVEQSPEAGTSVLRGSRVTVRFGRPGEQPSAMTRGDGN